MIPSVRTAEMGRRGEIMQTTAYEVDLCYSRRQLEALFVMARREDVEEGGRYDARGGALNFWTHRWNEPNMREESSLIGSLYVYWGNQNRIWRFEIEEGFSFEDLLIELGTLEEKALGMKMHGR
jgi:hypothetical protein